MRIQTNINHGFYNSKIYQPYKNTNPVSGPQDFSVFSIFQTKKNEQFHDYFFEHQDPLCIGTWMPDICFAESNAFWYIQIAGLCILDSEYSGCN